MTVDRPHFPPPEAAGGWPLARPEYTREVAGLDPDVLAAAAKEQEWEFGGDSWSISIVRHGVLAAEFRTFNVLDASRFDLWSATKSFTSLAFGILLGDAALAGGVDLDTPAYDHIPEGHPLTDERKQSITIGHLLSMTSGVIGETRGALGTPTRLGDGLFEHALGRVANRYGMDASRLVGEPGAQWDYSDPGYAHLSLVFSHLAGRELDEFLDERLFRRIGVPSPSWTRAGGGDRIGPHTVPHTGLVLSSRELARAGYLLLHGGRWGDEQIVPQEWVTKVTTPSQDFNPHYGYGFWTNAKGSLWPELPSDAFAMMGFRGNRCWVVPSLDLVVARTGSGPAVIDDRYFPGRILDGMAD